ncbi:MAG: TetR/AcrR family transcriptional regulator [Bacteroidetes bacterium]|nr:TetR/AcrR family transcriptional regulator [Bacteroidota bacterium]
MRIKEGNKEEDIIKAATRVFADAGFHNARMSRIADVAEVSNGSLYVYYKNKEEILMKILEGFWKELYDRTLELTNRDDITNAEKFDFMMDMLFDTFAENPDSAIIIANEQKHFQHRRQENLTSYFDKFIDLGERIVAEGVEKDMFNKNIDASLLRIFLLGGISELILEWAMNKSKISLNDIRSTVKFTVKHGILKNGK